MRRSRCCRFAVRSRVFTLTSLVGLLVNIAFYGLIFVLSLYFQQVSGCSAIMTGLAFVPMIGVVLAVNLMAALRPNGSARSQ